MPRALIFILVAVAALALVPMDGAAANPAQQSPDFTAIERHADQLLRDRRVPAAAIAIVRGDRIVYSRGFGTDTRGRPVTAQTSFILGSMSKSITALAVMQLVEAGRIALDAPVRQYLPAFRIASPDSGATITVRQLLLHTSGIPHGAPRGRGPSPSLMDHVNALQTVSPDISTGTTHRYASPNYLVLGAIVERVSGEPFGSYVERHIFAPLSMHNSFTERTSALENQFAGGNVYAFGFPVASSLAEERDRLPTAALMSSAEDLSHFLIMQLQRGRFRDVQALGGDFVRQMHTGGAPSEGFSYAFGWRDGTIAGSRAIHHGGIVADFAGRMIMLPDSGYGIVVLTNASSAIPWPTGPASHQLANDIATFLAGQPLPTERSKHRVFFIAVAAGMLLLVVMQLRTLRRAWNGSTSSSGGRNVGVPRRASAMDIAFILFVFLLPRFVGLEWNALLGGAPDVAWWLIAMAVLGAATVVVRLARAGRRVA